MMLDAWINFSILFFIQLVFFIIHAFYLKKLNGIPLILLLGFLMGMIVGLLSDLIWGSFFGLWSYTLDYNTLTVIATATLLYGLLAANVLLMQRVKIRHFFILTILMMVSYEVTNYFFRVWTYEFVLPPLGFILFLIIGNLVTAMFIALIWHYYFGRHFLFLDNFINQYK